MPVVPLLRRSSGGTTESLEISFIVANPGASGNIAVSVARKITGITGETYESPRIDMTAFGSPEWIEGHVCYRGIATVPSSTSTFVGTGNIYVFINGTRILPPLSSTNPDEDAPKCAYAHDPLTTSTSTTDPTPI
jgi:hypothetical protein